MLAVALGCFAVGLLAQRISPAARGLIGPLDFAVLSVTLPALILAKLPELELGGDLVIPVAAAWAAGALSFVLILTTSRRLGWDRATTGALLLVTPLGNTTFLGVPMVDALVGDDGVGSAIAYDQLGNFLGLAVYGAVIAAHWGSGEGGWRPVAGRLLRFPPFLAAVASFAIRPHGLPDGLVDTLGDVGSLVAPLAMLAVGLRFRLAAIADARTAAAWCLATKMVVMPAAVASAAVIAGGLDDPAWAASTMQAGMPPMVTAGVVAAGADLDGDLATTVVGVGLLISLVTIPLLSLLFRA